MTSKGKGFFYLQITNLRAGKFLISPGELGALAWLEEQRCVLHTPECGGVTLSVSGGQTGGKPAILFRNLEKNRKDAGIGR